MTIGFRGRTAAVALAAALLAAPATAAHALPGTPPPAAVATAATTTPAGIPELPRPTGPYAVGTEILHLTDHDRTDPWAPDGGPRELMVSVHHPARPGGNGPAPYMTTEEARLMLAGRGLEDVVPATTVSSTRTHARTHAPAARGRFPLVLLSPGFGTPRATLTSLAEDLAGRGYVVATVDHAYETSGTSFPGGRVLTCAACRLLEDAPDQEAQRKLLTAVSTGRAADLSFVLDRLTGRHSAWRHSRMIDASRVAVAGHSIGGSAAASALLADRRFDAGINMDGSFQERIPAAGLGDRPFMLLGTDSFHRPGGQDVSWNEDWPRLGGWKRWLTVEESGHFTFTDVPLLGEQLGLPVDPEAPLPGERSIRITRDYVAAFLDLHLKGRPQPLLDGPTSANPEVVFHHP
ncbi:alpha/beta hydrolase family protein [Streptomyces sp. NPDC056061]|uniref:alpha/beta hydrolase family protein n=1 Tax=Streptomyces sp. NPDC056061 TaxID=3345700 RepID=UPI0035DDF8A2